jgi:hypothetical protein
MKKTILLLTVALLFSTVTTFAQGGTTGPLTWNLENGTLTISGEGEMPNYSSPYEPPWLQYGSGISVVIIETGVTNISDYSFWYCGNLSSVTVGNSVTKIGECAFYYCIALKSVNLGNHLVGIGSGAFFACISLTSIIIPNSVINIGDFAFENCTSLTSIIIPNNVTNIGTNTFGNCNALTSVVLPKSITSIGLWAFSSCHNLLSITNLNPEPIIIDPKVFEHAYAYSCTLVVPNGSVSAYQNAEVWNEFNIVGGDYSVQVSVNNNEYGYAYGNELYPVNSIATVTASAFPDYKFVNWTKDGVEISTENPYNFTVTEDVELVANFEKEVGIVGTLRATSLLVYPNPTTDKLTINNEQLTIDNVEIFDVYGKKHHLITSSSHHLINIAHLPAGIYFLKISTAAGEVVKKIIKQ